MSRRGRSRRGQRDASSPSLAELLAPVSPTPALSAVHLLDGLRQLGDIQDERRFAPSPQRQMQKTASVIRPLRAVRSGTSSSAKQRRKSDLSGIYFSQPENVIRCVRRKERREVIFATKKRKKGAGASRRRRNFWSDVQC